MLRLKKPLDESLRPFRLHLYSLLNAYGPRVHFLDLLWRDVEGPLATEAKLAAAYVSLCRLAQAYELEEELAQGLCYYPFDLSAEKRKPGGIEAIPVLLKQAAGADVARAGATVAEIGSSGQATKSLQLQQGVWRVNCRGTSPYHSFSLC